MRVERKSQMVCVIGEGGKEKSQMVCRFIIRLLSYWQHLRELPSRVLSILSLRHVVDFKTEIISKHQVLMFRRQSCTYCPSIHLREWCKRQKGACFWS